MHHLSICFQRIDKQPNAFSGNVSICESSFADIVYLIAFFGLLCYNIYYMKICLIQMSAGTDIADNFSRAMKILNDAMRSNPDVVCFPENFLFSGSDKANGIMTEKSSEIIAFQTYAREHNVNLILGSVKLKTADPRRITNTCFVVNRKGQIVHRYDKIFMYDFHKNGISVLESASTIAGENLGLFELDGIKMGVGICVDFRFAPYFTKLAQSGAKIIFLPSAMRKLTGATAWEVLPRARAIENMVYFCACSQTKNLGGSKAGDACGESAIISYNGEVLVKMNEDEGFCEAEVDFEKLDSFRKEILMVNQFEKLDRIKLDEK